MIWKKNQYSHLEKWRKGIKEAASGEYATRKLKSIINKIKTDVATKDENVRSGVYDDLRTLIASYNKYNHRFSIGLDLVPSLPAREIEIASDHISYPDSPTRDDAMSTEEVVSAFNSIFESAPQISLLDQKGNTASIPTLNSFAQAGRAIRYQQSATQRGSKIDHNPFAVQQGETYILFEYRQDYVATPLKKHEAEAGATYMRDGQIKKLSELIRLIDDSTTIQNIIDIINNNVPTQPTKIQSEVAAAMVADNKNGIKNWITVMNALPRNPTIKNLLETEYGSFIASRSYKTKKPQTGSNTSLGDIPKDMDSDARDDDEPDTVTILSYMPSSSSSSSAPAHKRTRTDSDARDDDEPDTVTIPSCMTSSSSSSSAPAHKRTRTDSDARDDDEPDTVTIPSCMTSSSSSSSAPAHKRTRTDSM